MQLHLKPYSYWDIDSVTTNPGYLCTASCIARFSCDTGFIVPAWYNVCIRMSWQAISQIVCVFRRHGQPFHNDGELGLYCLTWANCFLIRMEKSFTHSRGGASPFTYSKWEMIVCGGECRKRRWYHPLNGIDYVWSCCPPQSLLYHFSIAIFTSVKTTFIWVELYCFIQDTLNSAPAARAFGWFGVKWVNLKEVPNSHPEPNSCRKIQSVPIIAQTFLREI